MHVFGTNATELVHIGQTVMGCGGTVDYLVDAVFNYPTLAESYKVAALDAVNRMRASPGSPRPAPTSRCRNSKRSVVPRDSLALERGCLQMKGHGPGAGRGSPDQAVVPKIKLSAHLVLPGDMECSQKLITGSRVVPQQREGGSSAPGAEPVIGSVTVSIVSVTERYGLPVVQVPTCHRPGGTVHRGKLAPLTAVALVGAFAVLVSGCSSPASNDAPTPLSSVAPTVSSSTAPEVPPSIPATSSGPALSSPATSPAAESSGGGAATPPTALAADPPGTKKYRRLGGGRSGCPASRLRAAACGRRSFGIRCGGRGFGRTG